jgi:hypothetical protein
MVSDKKIKVGRKQNATSVPYVTDRYVEKYQLPLLDRVAYRDWSDPNFWPSGSEPIKKKNDQEVTSTYFLYFQISVKKGL